MFKRTALYAVAALMFGCGGGGGGSSLDIQKNLVPVFNQSMKTAPVVTVNVKDASGTNQQDVRLRFYEESGLQRLKTADAITDANGNVSFSVPAGSYELDISGTGSIADFTGSITVTSAATQFFNYQTERRNFAMSAGQAIDETDLKVYQILGDGTVDRVFRDRDTSLNGAVSSNSVVAELFPGSYFATATAAKTAGGDTPLVKTSTLTASAAATADTALDLSVAGISILVTLQNTAGMGVQDYEVIAYDTQYDLKLETEKTNSSGVATILLGSATDTTLLMYDADNKIIGMDDLGNVTANLSKTYRQYAVTGVVQTPSGSSLVTDDQANVTVKLSSALAERLSENAGANIHRNDIAMTPNTGLYTVNLLNGNFVFGAEGVKSYPTITTLNITVNSADLTAKNISVNPGGVIRGTITNEAKVAVPLVFVEISTAGALTDANASTIDSMDTDTNGTYALEVPYGTYDVIANGAVTRNITVKASANDVVVDLTQYQLTGRATDQNGAGVEVEVDILGAGGDSQNSNTLGVYTVNVVGGINQICFTPVTSTTLGANCEFNVLVNDTTVAAFRK